MASPSSATRQAARGSPRSWTPLLLACVAGAAWQVMQPRLWPLLSYQIMLGVAMLGLLACFLALRRLGSRASPTVQPSAQKIIQQFTQRPHQPAFLIARAVLPMLCLAALVAGVCGWRAQSMWVSTLAPELEGRDVRIVGTIASMLQPTPQGQRWRMQIEQATLAQQAPGAEVLPFPEWVDLAWYAPRNEARDRHGKEVRKGIDNEGGKAAGNGPGSEANNASINEPGEDGSALPSPANLAVAPWANGRILEPGQRWEMTVRVKRPHGARNPHGFDYELMQWEQGVQASGYVRSEPAPQWLASTHSFAMQRARQWLRDRILSRLQSLQRWWPEAESAQLQSAIGVVAALAVGDQRAIGRQDWAVFRITGVAHLMSISGLHITMFAWLAALLVGRLWRCSATACRWIPAPQLALLAGVLLATLYALFSGWGLPAQRTICMLAVVALLRWLGVRWPWHGVWVLALAVVVLIDPLALWQAGFWLSFVAVGVLLATGLAVSSGAPDLASKESLGVAADLKKSAKALLSKAWALWREQWHISLALAPLGLLLFGQISVAGLLANLIAISWVTLVVTPLALASVVWADAAAWAALSLLPLMQFLQWLAQASWAAWFLPAAPWWAGGAAIAGGLLLVAPLPRTVRACGLALCLPALWWPVQRPLPGQFELLAVDIGQGNSVLLRTHTHTLLYDAGPQYSADNDAGERVLLPLFSALGERLDVMMLSHRDLDHTGGALAIKAAQPGVQVWGSGSVIDDPLFAPLQPVQRCVAGQRWQWDGVEFTVLHPGEAAISTTRQAQSPNANSCVLQVRAKDGGQGAAQALLAGDIEAPQEMSLVRAGALAPVHWLLVPHHGSRTSSSTEWVQALKPRWAVVQAGYRNRFGHPVPSVVQRYEQAGTNLVQNTDCGAALWRSAEPEQMQCERERHLRFWDVFVRAAP